MDREKCADVGIVVFVYVCMIFIYPCLLSL